MKYQSETLHTLFIVCTLLFILEPRYFEDVGDVKLVILFILLILYLHMCPSVNFVNFYYYIYDLPKIPKNPLFLDSSVPAAVDAVPGAEEAFDVDS